MPWHYSFVTACTITSGSDAQIIPNLCLCALPSNPSLDVMVAALKVSTEFGLHDGQTSEFGRNDPGMCKLQQTVLSDMVACRR